MLSACEESPLHIFFERLELSLNEVALVERISRNQPLESSGQTTRNHPMGSIESQSKAHPLFQSLNTFQKRFHSIQQPFAICRRENQIKNEQPPKQQQQQEIHNQSAGIGHRCSKHDLCWSNIEIIALDMASDNKLNVKKYANLTGKQKEMKPACDSTLPKVPLVAVNPQDRDFHLRIKWNASFTRFVSDSWTLSLRRSHWVLGSLEHKEDLELSNLLDFNLNGKRCNEARSDCQSVE